MRVTKFLAVLMMIQVISVGLCGYSGSVLAAGDPAMIQDGQGSSDKDVVEDTLVTVTMASNECKEALKNMETTKKELQKALKALIQCHSSVKELCGEELQKILDGTESVEQSLSDVLLQVNEAEKKLRMRLDSLNQ